jgi:hypothetical protein
MTREKGLIRHNRKKKELLNSRYCRSFRGKGRQMDRMEDTKETGN